MYSLVSAIGEPLGGGNRWRSVDIANVAMSDLYKTYVNVYAVLANDVLGRQVSLSLADVRGQYGTSLLTFAQVLSGLGNNALPTSDTLPSLSTKYACYADAFHAGYTIEPRHPSYAADAQVPPADKTDLFLTKAQVDYSLFLKSCLVSVNGFYHLLDADSTGVYVKDGNRSRLKSRQNTLGIYSFHDLGTLTYIPITPQMLYKQDPAQSLRQIAHLNVGQDISHKTVLLVLGGYLHILDNQSVFRVGDQALGVDVQHLPLLERYFESLPYLDYSGLGLETATYNDWQLGIDDFYSDAALTRYFTMSQSFIVLLDNPAVFVDHQAVHTTKMPGMFISYTDPVYPLQLRYGMHTPYWYTYEDRQWSLTSIHGVVDNPLYHTIDPQQERSVSDQRVPGLERRLSAARFLQVGCDVLFS